MAKIILTYLILLFYSVAFGQTTKPFDEKLISSQTELNLNSTDKRGFKYKNIVYFVADDKQTIVAVTENKIAWQTNIIKVCGTPRIGQAEIRYIKLQNDSIKVTFGKHDSATVDIVTGKPNCHGAD